MGIVCNYETSPDDVKSIGSLHFAVGDGIITTISSDSGKDIAHRGSDVEEGGHWHDSGGRGHGPRSKEGYGESRDRRWNPYPSYRSSRSWRVNQRNPRQSDRNPRSPPR